MIRVLLAEDQALVRGALAALLSLEADITVVAEVGRGDEVLPAALAARPDVALLDIEMPGGDGLNAAQLLQQKLPACRVIMLTTFGRSGYLRRAMASGAVGFLLKDAPASALADASWQASGWWTPSWRSRRSATATARSPIGSVRCWPAPVTAPASRRSPPG
jgi:two-component system response regulator DesR